MQVWRPWYAFEITDDLFALLRQVIRRQPELRCRLPVLLDHLTNEVGVLAGALSFLSPSDETRQVLIQKLAKACKRRTSVEIKKKYGSDGRRYEMGDGLRKAAVIAMSRGMKREALAISLRAPHGRPGIWSMTDLHSLGHVFPFLFRVALHGAVRGVEVHERDILPKELIPFARGLSRRLGSNEFKTRLNQKIEAQKERDRNLQHNEQQISSEDGRSAERFLNYRLASLLELTRALAVVLGQTTRQADESFRELVNVWAKVRTNREGYYP